MIAVVLKRFRAVVRSFSQSALNLPQLAKLDRGTPLEVPMIN